MDTLARCTDRRSVLWQVRAGYVSGLRRGHLALALPTAKSPETLVATSRARRMLGEYAMLCLCPDGDVVRVA